ncbi:MAG: hypothetical protein V2I26_14495 [Halieaceae bacterium]|jgi:hypothetical protein|nr:hypothetical protein [Halieaceae bacterium]
MQTSKPTSDRLRRTIDDLIIAEMFLVQATIESATAIGDGLSTLGRQITSGDASGAAPADTIGQTLQRIADDAVEPYTSRFRYLWELNSDD